MKVGWRRKLLPGGALLCASLWGCGGATRSSAVTQEAAGSSGAAQAGARAEGGAESGGGSSGDGSGSAQGGAVQGGAAQGGAVQGGAAQGGATPGNPLGLVPPEVSATWTWLECGRIAASDYLEPERVFRSIVSLAMSGDGQLLVTNSGIATAWRVAERFGESKVLWARGGEGAYNTDVSIDGRWVTTSGDTRNLFDARDGTLLSLPDSDSPTPNPQCFGTDFRFSPDGRYVAGKHYGTTIDVFDLTTVEQIAQIETRGCGQGLAFGRDIIITPEGSFTVSDWTATGELSPSPSTQGLSAPCSVYLEPSSAIRTACCDGECTTRVGDTVVEGGRHPSLSKEEHWLVAGPTLAHLPLGRRQRLDFPATEALFAPNGDVIAGDADGNLVRFCRQE